MSVNVIHLFRSTLPDAVVRQLSNCLGLPPEATAKVMDVSVPALIAGLLNKSATLDGARALFATILAQEVNADIGEQLPRALASTTGVTQLSSTGRELMEHVFERRIDGLSDAVSMQTGVPAHATHAVTGIAGSILMGVLKRYLLDHQGNIGQLPSLLGQQLRNISPYLNDGLTMVLGLGSASTFASNISGPIRAVSAHFERPAAAPLPVRGPVEPTMTPGATPVAAPPAVVREVRHAGLKAKHLFGVAILSALVGAIAAVSMWIALSFCPWAANFAGRNAVAAAATPAAPSVSAAVIDYNMAASQPAAEPASDAQAASTTGKVQNDVTPAVAKNSQLIVSVDKNGTPSITATVKTIAEKSALLNVLTKKFGAGKFNADITADDDAKPASWLEQIDALLPLMQTPGAELKIDGTRVELSGAAADAKNGWLDRLKALFGASYQVSTSDASKAEPAQAKAQ